MRKYIVSVASMAIFLPCLAQEKHSLSDSLVALADAHRLAYNFSEAVSQYQTALSLEQDTTYHPSIISKLYLGENGLNMTDFVYIPNVIAKRTFPLETFFLNYPLPDKSWHKNIADTLNANPLVKAVYIPSDEELYIAPDHSEIYPLISEDGRSRYFSSNEYYGVGGYDLYVSHWNAKTHTWGEPTNLGFPYSSPYDDMLYMDTADGKYTIFASNRECSKDSVTVYVLEHDSMPIRQKISDPQELRNIMKMVPQEINAASTCVEDVIYESDEIREYVEKSMEVKSLKEQIYIEGNSQKALRDSLNSVNKQLQQIEMNLLLQGVVVDLDKYSSKPTTAVPQQKETYVFTQLSLGEPVDIPIKIEEPEVEKEVVKPTKKKK